MTDLGGQSFGRYHLLEQLGEGGMATVYKAYDNRLERDVALKIIRAEQFAPAALQRVLQRFEREAKALARLSHPNIVKVLDFGEHDGSPFLILEFLPGGTLKQRTGTPMPWRQAARLLVPVAEALQYAHEQAIVHRDIKPSNILLTQSGQPMLSDFGIAKLLESEETATLTASGVGVGTPEYMAPEQAAGRPVDARADIYSLGVVLYELVTGRRPFVADTPMAVIIKQASEPLPRPKHLIADLPDSVERILLKALAKRPDDRYQDMRSFAQALQDVQAGSVKTKTTREPAVEKTRLPSAPVVAPAALQPALRSPRSFPLWAISVVLVVVGVAAFLGSRMLRPAANPPIAPTATMPAPTSALVIPDAPKPTSTASPTAEPSATPAPTQFVMPSTINWGGTQVPWPNRPIDADTIGSVKVLAKLRVGGGWNSTRGVAFSPDGQLIAYALGLDIHVIRAYDASDVYVLKGHTANIASLSIAPSGSLLASCVRSEVRLWSLVSGSLLYVLKSSSPVADCSVLFTPDSRVVAATFYDSSNRVGGVETWSVQDGAPLRVFKAGSGQFYDASFSPDGTMVAAGSNQNKVYVWKSDGTLLQTLAGAQFDLGSTTFSPDGRLLASVAADGTVWIWQVSDWVLVTQLHGRAMDGYGYWTAGSKLQFTTDSQLLIWISGWWTRSSPQAWRVADWQSVNTVELGGSSLGASASPDGHAIVVLWASDTLPYGHFLYLLGPGS